MLAHVDNRITYSGNGNATEFAYQFKILDRTDIKVMLVKPDGSTQILSKDYYVDVEKSVVRYPGYAVGAEVPESERPPVLPTGWKLTIYREVPVTQETDLPDQYPFNQVEDIGDKLTMIAQQLTDVTSRSLKICVNKSADIDTTIPFDAGKSFRIADDGKSIVLTEDPARVLPLAQGVYAQAQAQAQSAYASAVAAAKSEDSAAASASEAGNSAQSASTSAASAAESAELTSGYKQEALAAKADATASATNAKTSETNAKTSADSAGASKEAAQSAATTASNFASAARNSAGEAKTYKDNAKTYMDNAKNYSENVNVFVPSVSSDGVLSWTNRAGLANPASVNIKGDKGDKGDTGAQGIQGVKGDKGDKGDTGATGAPGTAATITIGSVTTGAAGSNASVSNSGTSTNAVLDFTIPRGNPGADGGVTVDAELSSTSTNPVQNKAVKTAIDTVTASIPTKVSAFINDAGYLTQHQSLDDYVKKNTANTYGEPQTFEKAVCKEVLIAKEVYGVSYSGGAEITLATNVVHIVANNQVTLDMAQAITDFLSVNTTSTVFSIYITPIDGSASYPLIITNAGTLKYVGSASDFAITGTGLLLNILMLKDSSGNVTSIAQASMLS